MLIVREVIIGGVKDAVSAGLAAMRGLIGVGTLPGRATGFAETAGCA